jgi:hypothetical protein
MKSCYMFALMTALFCAKAALPQGQISNAFAIYVSNYNNGGTGIHDNETNTTFPVNRRNCRLWAGNYYTLIRFDSTELTTIPANAPCTLYMAKDPLTTPVQTWNQEIFTIYLLRGTWKECVLDNEMINQPNCPSWNYRSLPKGWKTGKNLAEPVTGALLLKNSKLGNNGPDLNTPAFSVLDNKIIDSMRAGKNTGFCLQPGNGCALWLMHTGHEIRWGQPSAIEKGAIGLASSLSLSASPNPFSAKVTLAAAVSGGNKPFSFIVYDIHGKKVADFSAHPLTGKTTSIGWEPVHLQSGIYLATLTEGNRQMTKRLTLLR